MSWPQAFVAAVGIVAVVIVACAFFWMLANTTPVESSRDAILWRNAETPMSWRLESKTTPVPKSRWEEGKVPAKRKRPTPKETETT